MNPQRGMSSLALVLLLLVLGTLMLGGLNKQLSSFSALVGGESRSVQEQASVHSALSWGRVQRWATAPQVQCKAGPTGRVCVRLLSGARVLLIAGSRNLLLWQRGEITNGQIQFSLHGWSDFCPLKESTLCQLP